jgi:hypothetical protein
MALSQRYPNLKARVTKLSIDSPLRDPFFEGTVLVEPAVGEQLVMLGPSRTYPDDPSAFRRFNTSPIVEIKPDVGGVVFKTESGRLYKYEEIQ